ncbi:MAG: hypothetical protein UT08_C0020G0002 [Candidatus Woesebacteria bacterium GW2011_GWB1_38_8]|uniref:LamG-like jellyroll fold domain-containing protein n=1 Tax=Candidatus Woesebacteria bacterium GW2011_GWB1_38_8 TaxID=1618570 RepID=A0A0G0KX74_9BACT|nr:MAG: hypothetical protein UT08_C0020G0002 [Candidatus Woesebacteria bacterium GW2011_GWB1_38_8]
MSLIRPIYKFFTVTRRRKILASILAILILFTSVRFLFFNPKEVRADSTINFDEGYGTTINDDNNNVSGITNATWKPEEFCVSNKCLYFDGTDDTITFDDDPDLDFSAADNFTIEGWFRTPDIAGGQRTIISKYDPLVLTDGGYQIYMNSNGYLVFAIDNNNTFFPSDSVSTSPTAFDDNLWHQFAAVKSGISNITIYVDTVQYETDSTITNGNLFNTDEFLVGSDMTVGAYWSGFIDEIKVYRSARNSNEIKSDFLKVTSSRGSSISVSPNQKYLSNGLVGYWKLDEASGNPADSSGNALTLANNGTTLTTFVPGKFYRGSEHVPASLQYFSIATAINGVGVQSVSFWVNPDSNSNYYISLASTAYITSTAGTLSATGFTNPKIYVNGQESTTITANVWSLVTVTTKTGIYADQIYIGRQDSNYFDGTMDDVRFYNRVFSPAEVINLYKWGPGPAGYWNFDEGTGTVTANDRSGNAYHLDLTSGTESDWKPGKFGGAHQFDGSADYATATPENGAFSSNIFSLGTWIYRNSDSGAIEKIADNQDADNDGWTLMISATDKPTCSYNATDAAATTSVTTSTWYHLGCTSDGTTLTVYINGVMENSAAISGSISETTDMRVAAQSYGTSEKFPGIIDDLRVYNYSRSAQQVIEDMNAGHPAPGSPIGSAVAYWKLNDAQGNFAQDATVNNNDLALNNASWTLAGKFGAAWFGNGSVWMTKSDDADLNFAGSQDFSLSLWVKSSSANNPAASEFLINKHLPTNNPGYRLYFNTSGQLVCEIDDDTTSFPEDTASSSTDYYDAQWHNVLCERDITGDDLNLYVDAKLVDDDGNLDATGDLSNTGNFTLGSENVIDGTDEFNGYIDEVKIFRSALDSNQVKVLYNQSSAASVGTLGTDTSGNPSSSAQRSYCPPGNGETNCAAGQDPSPILEWKLDENTGTTNVYDTSGNDNTGTMNGAMTESDWVPGKKGSALDLDGSNDSLSLADDADLDFVALDSFTIEAWIKHASATDQEVILSKEETAGADGGYVIRMESDGDITCGIDNDNSGFPTDIITSTAATYDDGNWHHIACIKAAILSLSLYIDGKFIGTNTSITGSSLANNDTFYVGRDGAGTASAFWTGQMDNIEVFRYARPGGQIAWDYNRGNPVALWKLNENTGTTTNDSSENGYHSQAFTGNTTWIAGKLNTALTFDGTDDNVRITEGTGIDLGAATDSYSVSAWMKTSTDFTVDAIIITKWDNSGSPNSYPYRLYINPSEQACFQISDGTNAPSTCGSTVLNDGSWHLITGLRNVTTDTLYIYIDGKLANSANDTVTLTTVNNDDVSFGCAGLSYNQFDFNGQIDDVRIYNYVLTPQQIKLIMNESAVRMGPNEGSP